MTSITLTSQTPAAAARPSVGAALRELAVAGRHLIVALLSTLRSDRAARAQQLSVFQEAENLRTFANTLLKTDPGFAADLYAAADRHEIEHGA